MEGRLRKGAVVVLLLPVAVLALAASPAAGLEDDTNVEAGTDGQVVTLRFSTQRDGSGRAVAVVDSCEVYAIPSERVQEFQEAPGPAAQGSSGPDDELYVVWSSCDMQSNYYWLGPSNFVDPTGPIIQELLDQVLLRPALVDVRPNNRGITGIESLFWLQGPGTQRFSESRSGFGLTVMVTVDLAGVEWDFGDGTPIVSAGLGEAWPEHSSLRHAYRDASGDTPYTVTARLIFQPTYTVNGAPGAPLDPIVVPIEREYVVRQVQAVRQY